MLNFASIGCSFSGFEQAVAKEQGQHCKDSKYTHSNLSAANFINLSKIWIDLTEIG